MDYGFKKLSDVDIVETPNESAHVLIEENGVIKKAPKDKVGGATSWNDLKDKPFYEEVTRTLIVEGIADESGYYRPLPLPINLKGGLTYVFSIDGIECSGVCYNDSGWSVDLKTSDDKYLAYVYTNSIQLDSDHVDFTIPHRIELLDVTVKQIDPKFLSDIALAKNIIIDRQNRTLSFGKYVSSEFNYDGAEDYYLIYDSDLYKAVKELVTMGCGIVLKSVNSYGETEYAPITIATKFSEGRIIIADFYVYKE